MKYYIVIYIVIFQPGGGLLSLEAAEVLDRMREGADRLRNNTNSFLSGELLGLVPVRISVSGETDESSLRIKPVPRHHPGITDGTFYFIFSYFSYATDTVQSKCRQFISIPTFLFFYILHNPN